MSARAERESEELSAMAAAPVAPASAAAIASAPAPAPVRITLPDLDMKYNGRNGQKWVTLAQRTLKAAYLGKHLTEAPPMEDAYAMDIWDSEEALIMNWMIKNMEEEQKDDYLLVNIVRDLWKEINKSCAEVHKYFRVYDLREQERKLKQGSMSISSYSAKLKAIWRELDLLFPAGDRDHPSYIREVTYRTIQFLMGLNPEYEVLRSQLLHRERFPTLEEAISELQGAESRKTISTKGSGTTTSTTVVHLAKKEGQSNSNSSAAQTTAPQQPKASPKEGNTSDLICGYCRKPGHIKKECRKLAWKEEQVRKGTWNPGQHKKAYLASEGEETQPSGKKEEDADLQKILQMQSEVNKLL
ncbi:uncharacterized protein LOC144706195 [Wolffia australiana]